MFNTPIEIAYSLTMLIVAATGAYCAHNLNCSYPWWVRAIVMIPAVLGMFAPVLMVMGAYVPYLLDVFFAIAVAMLYALVASRFSSTPWLDLRCKKG